MTIRNPKDFWAGLMFMAFGAAFVVGALGTPAFLDSLWGGPILQGYQLGSAVRMGPAYFPAALGGILVLLGAVIFLRSLASRLKGEAVKLHLPFGLLDLVVVAAVFAVLGEIAERLGISKDYAMLASAAVMAVLAAVFRPDAKPIAMILASSLAFAYLLVPLGLVLATVALVFVGAFGGHEFRWKEVTILTAVLVVFSVLVFVEGLTLPFPICPAFVTNCPIH
ncbi:MAG TPA: tripartite tricarboxylate transporter TctB family protein [Burkholderiales bacterium]|nr:tripartite tricarboxylate transporter TctB family protein [Burkholderiales bacterium]